MPSDCCDAIAITSPSIWGISAAYYVCGECGHTCTRLDYPEAARPTREDDDASPRSACCDAPLESGDSAHWCSADGCGRQARPDGDGYNVRPGPTEDSDRSPVTMADLLRAAHEKGAKIDVKIRNRGPCERVGRYLDGALATVRESLRLLTRRGHE